MTAPELLTTLRQLGIQIQVEAGRLCTRPAGAVPEALRPALVAHREELLGLVDRTCPSCGATDYMPLDRGWRRCWACGTRWGRGRDPGDPPQLERIAELLDLAARL